MPKLTALLNDLRFPPEIRAGWLENFKERGLSDAEVAALVDPKRKSKQSKGTRQRLMVARHGLRRWLRSKDLFIRLAYGCGWLFLLISWAVKLHWGLFAIISVVAVVVGKIRFVIRDLKPKNMQLISRGYNERKMHLQRLIETIRRSCPRERQRPATSWSCTAETP